MHAYYKVRTGVRRILIFLALLSVSICAYRRISPRILLVDRSTQEDRLTANRTAPRLPRSVLYNYSRIVRDNVEFYRRITLPVANSEARSFVRMKSWYRIAPRYKMSGCIVEKSMCTIVQGIFCYLFDSEGFVRKQRSIVTEPWSHRFCMSRNEPGSTQERDLLMPYATQTLFVARDPMERFLSGFTDKCILEQSSCYGCKGKVLCAIEGLHGELMSLSRNHFHVIARREQALPVGYEAQHMAPQTWFCDLFDEYQNTVFLRYGERNQDLELMHSHLLEILRDHGVEDDKLEHIRKSISKHTHHTTKNNPVRESLMEEIRNSPRHFEMLMQLYKYDYEVFGFSPPINVS